MKHLKRLTSVFLALLLCFCSLNLETVYAADADETQYTQLFSTPSSAYYVTCQPDSAIVLTDDVNLTPAMLSPNYKGGVVDLPRLQADCMYVLSEDNPNYILQPTLYPTLSWTTEAIGTDVTLYIVDSDGIVKYSVSIAISDSFNSTNMGGIDIHYKESVTSVAEDGSTTTEDKVVFHDCSENIVNTLVSQGDSMRYYNVTGHSVKLYDAAMNKTSIVFPNYMYTPDNVSGYGRMSAYEPYYTYKSFVNEAYNFSKMEGDDVETKYNVKDYARILYSGRRPGLLFYGSKTKDCSFNNNTGECVTVTGITDVDPLYYFIALDDQCYFSKITGACTEDELKEPLDNTPKMVWTVGKTYSLKSGTSWLDAGFVGNPDSHNPNYMNYGPVELEEQFKYHLSENFETEYNVDELKITPGSDYCKDCNYYARSLIYNAAIAHLGNCTMNLPSYEVTLNYYYKSPTDDKWTYMSTKTYNASEFAKCELEKLPELENYTDDTWYTDTGFNVKLNPASFSKTQNKVLNVYGQYKYANGYYSIVFVDDNAKTTETKTFKVSDQPTLPATPMAPDGYDFANWLIVNSPTATSGIAYDASAFQPNANVTYYFKATWATKGVISGIDITKTKYYVGEALDKTTITVYVRSDDTGNVIKATSDSYEFNSEVVRRVGTNAITITYKTTGYKYTFYVEGIERKVESIEAEYTGGKVKVGSSLNPSAFTVTATYSDGSTAEVTDFSISPTVCKREGENTVSISHLDVSATCMVTGIKATEYKPSVPIESITTAYKGKQLKVGDKIKADDLAVVVSYANGERITLANSDFTYSPTTAEYAGDLRVTCTFKSVEGSCIVPIKESTPKPADGNTSNNNGDNGSTGDNTHQDNNWGNNTNNDWNNNNNNWNNNTSNNSGSTNPWDDIFNNGGSTNTDPGYTPTQPTTPDNNTPTDTGDQNTMGDNTHTEPDNKTDGKGTSPGYLNGANILTNTIGVTPDIELGYTTLLNLCKNSENKQSIFVNLINSRTGNTLTKECLKLVKEKDLTVYITMTDASDKLTTVANWTVMGSALDNVEASLDLNVMFETTDKNGERLVYIAPSSAYYPMGLTLSVSPLNTYYGSGDLIRQYSCTPAYTDSMQVRAFTWEENNYITYDLYSGRSVCLSDSRYVYPDGSSLLDDPSKLMANNTTTDTPANTLTEEQGSTTDPFENVDWEASTHKKNVKTLVFIIGGSALAVAGIGAGAFIVLKRKRH